jgi:TATA-box binding protein (TBP) (component of TFIID and TFIIIB)
MEDHKLICDMCNCPTFICKCDTTWNYFDKILENNCSGDKLENVVYTSLKISTMTVCFKFNQPINLQLLKQRLPESLTVNFSPGSKKSKVPKKKGTDSFYNSFDIKITIKDHQKGIYSNVSIFIFPNGKAKAAGVKTINTINTLLEEMVELVRYVPESVEDPDKLGIENIKIQMICSDFKIKPIKEDPDGWCINQKTLKNILTNNYNLSATFSALSRYPGINLKVESVIEEGKQISLLIFRSGSIIITGGKNAKDLANCYKIITDIITTHSSDLFYYDINEEIKQKKKKKN